MTPITTTKAKLLFVEAPDDVKSWVRIGTHIILRNKYYIPVKWIEIPSGSTYTFLFTTKQGREEDWKGVVGKHTNVQTFIATLETTNGLDVNKNYAVIKID